MNIWVVCFVSIAAGFAVGMLIHALKDSTKLIEAEMRLLEAELRAERAERKNDISGHPVLAMPSPVPPDEVARTRDWKSAVPAPEDLKYCPICRVFCPSDHPHFANAHAKVTNDISNSSTVVSTSQRAENPVPRETDNAPTI